MYINTRFPNLIILPTTMTYTYDYYYVGGIKYTTNGVYRLGKTATSDFVQITTGSYHITLTESLHNLYYYYNGNYVAAEIRFNLFKDGVWVRDVVVTEETDLIINDETEMIWSIGAIQIEGSTDPKSLPSNAAWKAVEDRGFVINRGVDLSNNSTLIYTGDIKTSEQIRHAILNENDTDASKWIIGKAIKSGKISLELPYEYSLYISENGNDDNDGLSADFPKKTLTLKPNCNVLIQCGTNLGRPNHYTSLSNCYISAYGDLNDGFPKIDCYKEVQLTWTQVDGYTDMWEASLSHLDCCYTTKDKMNCNIGSLRIDGVINWNRHANNVPGTTELEGGEIVYNWKLDEITGRNEIAWIINYIEDKIY